MDTVLQVTDLSKSYGAKKAVDRIGFSVGRGEIMGLLGPNGAGKTTAIRMIMGILPGDSGEVAFSLDGQRGGMDKTRIGYLPEERGLYDDVGVLNNLVYLAALKGMSRAEAAGQGMLWLEKMGLADYAAQKLEKLSKGMQQKVQFIASILHSPQLVLFDEPFSGLDPVNQDFIKEIIRDLQSRGVTVLLSAHQMNLVEELCDRILLINHGQEVLSGSLQEIKRSYEEHLLVLRFDPGEDSSFVRSIPGMRVVSEEPGLLMLRYCGTQSTADLLQQLSSEINLHEISLKKPPLHEIFIETVRKRSDDHAGA